MDNNKKEILYIPLEDIIPNRFQPRLAFDEKELNSLANSIIKYGVIQPIVVRNIGEKYEIIAGERRYKASELAGLKKIPAIVNNTDDNTSAEIALLENLQRKNLSVIEEAKSYRKLLDRGFTQESIASKLGISQSTIANKIRLLSLSKSVQNALLYNKISERHARCLLTLDDDNIKEQLLDRIINEKLTVKQTEDEVSKLLNNKEETKEENFDEIYEIEKEDVNEEEYKSVDNINNIKIFNDIEYFDPLNYLAKAGEEEPKEEPTNNLLNDETRNLIEDISNEEKNYEINLDELPEKVVELDKKEEDEYKIKVDKIRAKINFIKSSDNFKTTEEDLGNKYRIIIEIDK